MRERFPFEVFARIATTKDDQNRVLKQYVITIKTRDGKQKEFRSSPGLQELDVVNFLRQVDKLTLRLTAQNFVRLRKNFFLSAAEGYGILEDNMCDCTAEMVVRQFMGSLEELIDFEYQNFSGQNKWSIPITPTTPTSGHVVVKFTSPKQILEKTSIPTFDHLYSYGPQGNRVDAQTRGLRAVQQRYIFGGPLDKVNCYPETETHRKDHMEKLTNFTFIIPVTEKLFREIRIHNTRVFPRNQPIEVYREYVVQEIDYRIIEKPEIKMQWLAIKINLRDEIVLALYSMFKIGKSSVVYFEEKNFFSTPEWAIPKELHHFAKYFMSVLQLPDSEADKTYSLMSAPYMTTGETLYRTEVMSEQEIVEDDARLRCCPNMTTRETELANRLIPPDECLVYHNGDVMTEKALLDADLDQRFRNLFAPVQLSHTCPNSWRKNKYPGRKSNRDHYEQQDYEQHSGASTSEQYSQSSEEPVLENPVRQSNIGTVPVESPAPAPVNQVVPSPAPQLATPAPSVPVANPARNGRQQADADGWVLVNRGNRSLPVPNQAEHQEDNSSSESFDLVTSSDSEQSDEEDSEEEEEPAPRPQEEIDAEERRRANKRRRQRNRRERIRQEAEATGRAQPKQADDRQDDRGDQESQQSGPGQQEVSPALNVGEPMPVPAPLMGTLVLPFSDHLDYETDEENYIPPPVNDVNVPRCLDYGRLALYQNMSNYLEKKVNQFEYYPDKQQQFMDRYVQFNNVYRTQYEICTLFTFLKYQTKPVRNLCEKFFVHKARSLVSPEYANSEFLEEMQANSWAAEQCSKLLTEIDVENLDFETLTHGLSYIDMKCDILHDDHPFLPCYRVICDRLIAQGYEQRVFFQVITTFFGN